MEKYTGKHAIGDTSALVLLWAGEESFQTEEARRYLQLLDLSAGIALYTQCNSIWQYYGELIKNRKYMIMNLIKECIDEESSYQIVITGAGFNPLSIDCKVTFHESKVFDIDINCMNTKRKLLDSIGKQALREITLVEADLENLQEVAQKLSLNGWDKNRPTIAIFEGISYYISRKALRDLITLFSSGNSYIIVEYLKPDSEIDPTRRHIPMGVFNRIMQSCSLDTVERYTIDELTKIPGVNLIRKLTMEDVEKSRTGKNKYFQSSNSGWIEIAVFST